MTFGEWLKTNREARGMTQEALAEKADTKHPTISRLENGKAAASKRMITRLAAAMRVNPDQGLALAGFAPASEGVEVLSSNTPNVERISFPTGGEVWVKTPPGMKMTITPEIKALFESAYEVIPKQSEGT